MTIRARDDLSQGRREVLVYVQALPTSGASSSERYSNRTFAEYFQDAQDFVLSHSSKVAISKALALGVHEIVAIGYAPVLHEAIARGATRGISVPLCDNPLEQARSFPKGDGYSQMIIIGENPDGPFTGASLAGVLVSLQDCSFEVWNESSTPKFSENTVALVTDLCESTSAVDIRRIKGASEQRFSSEAILGNSRVSSARKDLGPRQEILKGETRDLSRTLSKRLLRFALLQ